MKKLIPTVFAFAVASVTALASGSSWAQDIKGDAKAGEGKVAMCVGCHGIKGYQASFPEVYKVPMIAGQSAGYIKAALTAYRGGDRKHPSMRGIADSLSDQDIADVAAYYSTLGVVAGETLPAAAEGTPKSQGFPILRIFARLDCPRMKLMRLGARFGSHGTTWGTPSQSPSRRAPVSQASHRSGVREASGRCAS